MIAWRQSSGGGIGTVTLTGGAGGAKTGTGTAGTAGSNYSVVQKDLDLDGAGITGRNRRALFPFGYNNAMLARILVGGHPY